MKIDIKTGAYGWRHSAWLNSFYPDDLPAEGEEDWRLAYYSNEFNTVLVPTDYWQHQSGQAQAVDCERWLDDVNDDFQFLVECHAGMFEHQSFDEVAGQLKKLQPQLSALIFFESQQKMPELLQDKLCELADSLKVNVFADSKSVDCDLDLPIRDIWRQKNQHYSDLALVDNDLTDLRLARTIVDDFMSQTADIEQKGRKATIIASHPGLQASDLSQFRAMLEVMGY